MTAKEYTDRAMKIMPMQQLGKHGKEHIRKCLLVLFEECLGNNRETVRRKDLESDFILTDSFQSRTGYE